MIIRYASDLHLGQFRRVGLPFPTFPPLPEDKDTVLVLAGDFMEQMRIMFEMGYIGDLAAQFGHIVIVLGNHDYYGHHSIHHAAGELRFVLDDADLQNVHVLQNDTVIIDRTLFVGATLWTDFKKSDPLVLFKAPEYLRYDFSTIAYQGKIITPVQMLEEHNGSLRTILKAAERPPEGKWDRVVVVSHHAPSYQSVHARFRYRKEDQQVNNWYFVSDLESRIFHNSKIDLWIHGHVHNNFDYCLPREDGRETRVVCNPLGYIQTYRDSAGINIKYENPEFNSLAKVII